MGWKNVFRNNTRLEKKLIIFIVILCAVVLILFIILFTSGRGERICDSPECVRAATHILDMVDPSVDPCKDFYKFACGTFLKNAFSLGQPTPLYHIQEKMKNQLKEIVVENEDRRNSSRKLLIQRKFYRKCMNDTAIEEDNDQTFLNLLDEVVGGWPPAKGHWEQKKNFSWDTIMVKARELGFFYEFYLKVGVTLGNDSKYMLWIRPPDENDGAPFYWKNASIDLMNKISSDLKGYRVDKARDLTTTLDFAEQLNKLIKDHKKNNKDDINSKRQDIAKNIDHDRIKIDWLNLLRNLTGDTLNENSMVMFEGDDYFTDLYYLLHKTPKRVQATYMAWAIISTNIQYMTKKIRDKYKEMQQIANGTQPDLSRRDVCYQISTELFKHVAEGEYVRRYLPPPRRKYIRNMIDDIKTELHLVLEEISWMDEETKSNAIQHLQNITAEIGATEIVYDGEKFEKSMGYNQLKITSAKLIDIARMANIHRINRYYLQLWQTLSEEEEEFINTPKLEANALYLTYFNKLILLAPLLQEPVFVEGRPFYMNYGALGSIIGHEFMHGFIQLEDDTWWTNATSTKFKSVSQCIIDGYEEYSNKSGFSVNNHSVVFEENMADFSSVNLAYTAYIKSANRNFNPRLPGVQYTSNQLFWIMTGTYLCHEPTVLEEDTKKESRHGVPSYRVLGRLQNSPYFAKDFNCPVGSPMNPANKCRIFA